MAGTPPMAPAPSVADVRFRRRKHERHAAGLQRRRRRRRIRRAAAALNAACGGPGASSAARAQQAVMRGGKKASWLFLRAVPAVAATSVGVIVRSAPAVGRRQAPGMRRQHRRVSLSASAGDECHGALDRNLHQRVLRVRPVIVVELAVASAASRRSSAISPSGHARLWKCLRRRYRLDRHRRG